MAPKPSEPPYKTTYEVFSRDNPIYVFGTVVFEDGPDGRFVRARSDEDDLEFTDIVEFARHITPYVHKHDEWLDGKKALESEPELWGNIDH